MAALFVLKLLLASSPDAGTCDAAHLKSAREAFTQRYRKRRYGDALAVLEPVFTACELALPAAERARILSDLSIAAYRAGSRKRCLAFLSRVPGDAKVTDSVAYAIDYNRALCSNAERDDVDDCRSATDTNSEEMCVGHLWESAKGQLQRVVTAAEQTMGDVPKPALAGWRRQFRKAQRI